MGRVANLSPLGLYSWDNTLFDLMEIPDALDKDVLIQNILAETAELEVLYPNPVVMKNLLGVWSRKQIDVWNKLWQTTQYEYNPIENYNRYETGSEDGTGSTSRIGTGTATDTTRHSGTDSIATTMRDGGSETEAGTHEIEAGGSDEVIGTDQKGHWIAGYDAPTPTEQDDGLFKQTRDQDDGTTTTNYGKTEEGSSSKTTTFGKTETGSGTKTYGETVARTGQQDNNETVNTNNVGSHELHAHGNIGVTTTQKLIREQRDIDLFNLYDIIKEDFKMRFCILVY